MTPSIESKFNHYYSLHCKHLKLKGLQPKTIEAYSRAIRRIGAYFQGDFDNLSQDQLVDYFHDLLNNLSWSAVKLDLYGLKFFYTHVLNKPWVDIPMIKPPRCTRIPDIVMCQHFSGQLFKLLIVAIRNQLAINNHWPNECVLDYKRLQYIQI